LHNFYGVNHGFPAAKQTTPTNQSWYPFILPYIEQENLFKRYRFDLDWDDAATNDADPGGVNQAPLEVFLCPSAPPGRKGSRDRGITDYDAVDQITRPNAFVTKMPPSDPTRIGILGKDVRRRMAEITDGTSNTILLAESAGRNQTWEMGAMTSTSGTTGAWPNPDTAITLTGYDPSTMSLLGPCAVNCTNKNEIYAFHTGIANVLMGDGTVRSLQAGLDINIAIALMTRSIGDTIPGDILD